MLSTIDKKIITKYFVQSNRNIDSVVKLWSEAVSDEEKKAVLKDGLQSAKIELERKKIIEEISNLIPVIPDRILFLLFAKTLVARPKLPLRVEELKDLRPSLKQNIIEWDAIPIKPWIDDCIIYLKEEIANSQIEDKPVGRKPSRKEKNQPIINLKQCWALAHLLKNNRIYNNSISDNAMSDSISRLTGYDKETMRQLGSKEFANREDYELIVEALKTVIKNIDSCIKNIN